MTSVFVMVFDGLQPSQIIPGLMPNLSEFADKGVQFARHHPVFPTVTRINAASMVTGRYPGSHGLAGNTMVMRELDPAELFPVLEPGLRRLAAGDDGRVLLSPTLADILTGHGKQYLAVGVGTSGNAFVHNPHPARSNGATIHPEFCLPDALFPEILERFGPWPGEAYPNAPRVRHAGRIATDYALGERQADVTLLWSSEPDKSQHRDGVNSALGVQALAAADEEFGRVLEWLDASGRATTTDVFVVSDHGYSTIDAVVPVEAMVRDAGFPATGPGGVVVAPNGGSVIFYTVPDGGGAPQHEIADRLARWLMAQPWCGALLTSEAAGEVPGTLPLALSGGDGRRAPDLAMSFAWTHHENEFGVPGHAFSSGGTPGAGQHGSMSPHELRNTLVVGGPSFRTGLVSETPSGNVDIAPTILKLLGLPGGETMDGRVLSEALLDGGGSEQLKISVEEHRAERIVAGGVYRQVVTTSRVGETVYLDGGEARLE